ncbi:MAG: FliA/WhiG family RNA polymerase sigma factor [Clostridiales bacterium]|nr:FliA/WhiG family RNA polymerase sigma factor [Clostridiales bacterium]
MYKIDSQVITTELWEEYKETHDINLRNEILLAYIHVVTFNAKRMSAVYKNYAQTGDIINQGVLALIDCIEKYDCTRGIQFDSFASIRVRGSIIDYIRKQDWIPRRVRKKSADIGNAYMELQDKTGRQATDSEVAEYLGMNVEELNKTIGEVYSAAVFYYEDLLQDSVAAFSEESSKVATPEQEYQKKELKELIAKSIDRLDEKERTVISLYYYEELKLKEIALVMGLTASRVSQLHSKALLKLQKMVGDYVKD